MTLTDEFFATLHTNSEIQWLIICFHNNYLFYCLVALSHFPTKYSLGKNFVISQHFNI